MGILRYVSHPDVSVDPSTPVPLWSISDAGRARAIAAAGRPWAIDGRTRRITW
ncbi:MAG: hypothetical protein WA964_05000 [Ilumatobacter sp.]|uniref:hypothetical protein n=1 Tax=Ilumatobacter sp. TaxID=1967498 RepID=UPI003C728BB9